MQDNWTDAIEVDGKIKKSLKAVSKRLGSFGISEFGSRELFEPSTYLLRSPGKMLRPALVFLGADYIGVRDLGGYVGLAAAIELLHTSSLVHDDIVDKDVERRGMESTHLRYGVEAAMLSGDALISKAVYEANRYGKEVVDSISEAAMKMCAGELMDYSCQRDSVVPDLEGYLRIAELKSSTLIGVAAGVAALHRSDRRTNGLFRIGRLLGTAFQVRDDVIDFLGAEGKNGKERFGNRPNVIRCMIEHEGRSVDGAVGKAVELNRTYVRKAINGLGKGSNAALFRKYAMTIALEVQGKARRRVHL